MKPIFSRTIADLDTDVYLGSCGFGSPDGEQDMGVSMSCVRHASTYYPGGGNRP